MKHVRSSAANSIYFLEHLGNPNIKDSPTTTDFNEEILSGSLCVDRVNNDLYILRQTVWEKVGNDFEALLVQNNTEAAVIMSDYNGIRSYGVLLNSPNSTIEEDVENTVVIGGANVIASIDNTVYVPQIGFFGTDGTAGNIETQSIFSTQSLTESRTWKLPDSSGTIALIDDVSELLELLEGGLFGTNFLTSVPTLKDKDLVTLETSGDESLACSSGIFYTPIDKSYVTVFINGQEFEVGDGVKDKPFYFSGDGGSTPKGFSEGNFNGRVTRGDKLYYNSSYTGFDLEEGWRLSLHYNIIGDTSGNGDDDYISEIRYLHELEDVNLTYPITNDHYLRYETTTQKWINTTIESGVSSTEVVYYKQLNISSNTILIFKLLKNYKIQDIIIKEVGGYDAGNITIESSSGVSDIVNLETVSANSLVDCLISKRLFSLISDTNLYIRSNNWGSGVVDVYITIRKISL